MKKINSKADLTINGLPPAFEEKLHVGRVFFDQLTEKIGLDDAKYVGPSKFSINRTKIQDAHLIESALLKLNSSSIRFENR